MNLDDLIQQKMREIDALVAQQAAQRATGERFGEDSEYEDGAIIVWTRRFSNSTEVYNYAALKIGALWFTTENGGRKPSVYSFGRLLTEQLRHADQAWIVTEMRELL